jgi:beta-lactamase superfamily II metal-dependent hydrolase
MSRRGFMGTLGALAVTSDSLASSTPVVGSSSAAVPGASMSPWTPGTLDIHHISTGRGNCAFLLCPDGTSIMIDAGANSRTAGTEKYVIQTLPNESRRPGEWISRYVQPLLASARRDSIDYFLLTHLHDDHMGGVTGLDLPRSVKGDYLLTGVTDVAEHIGIRKIIDRAYPSYSYPSALDTPSQRNYRAYLREHLASGGAAEQFLVGSSSQIRLLREAQRYSSFGVRNLAANGRIWTGHAADTASLFPQLDQLPPEDYPTENKCSVAIRLDYGAFSYFSGGDLESDTSYGRLPWTDVETPVARACGQVEVAVAGHHGYFNACGPQWVRALRARAFVISAWDSAHPTIPALENMLSHALYPGERDVFATAMKAENRIVTRRVSEMKSDNGHVVVRVFEGGASFSIFVLDNTNESFHLMRALGPYACRT